MAGHRHLLAGGISLFRARSPFSGGDFLRINMSTQNDTRSARCSGYKSGRRRSAINLLGSSARMIRRVIQGSTP